MTEARSSRPLVSTLLARAAGRCSFPDCRLEILDEHSNLLGDLARILSSTPGGPRYDAGTSAADGFTLENLIVLCPTHHRAVDAQPDVYTADWLRDARRRHEEDVKKLLETVDVPPDGAGKPTEKGPFGSVLGVWAANQTNADEEFWQRLFVETPSVIGQSCAGHVFQMSTKCYVGGKHLDNKGGNLSDYVYANRVTKSVSIVEIKTPMMPLLGSQYRSNAYSISEELSGTIVQVLVYRDALQKHYHSLRADEGELATFQSFNPRCLIIAGNVGAETRDAVRRGSLELFRSTVVAQVEVLGYDELFGKVADLNAMLEKKD